MLRPSLSALCALVLSLSFAAPARAVPDVPIGLYLDHVAPLELEWPAVGTVTDGFGYRWGRRHLGIDVGVLTSLEVRAATSGTVAATGWLRGYEGYGHVVEIDRGRGRSVLYAHLSASTVAPGQWVAAGEPIGVAGCTGSCTGTHLHFELRRDGIPVDPASFMAYN